MAERLEIHLKYDGRTQMEKVCETIDRLREKYPDAKIIVNLSAGVQYGRKQ